MINKLILLVDKGVVDLLIERIQPEIPHIKIEVVFELEELKEKLDAHSRLVSFGTSVIVPEDVLNSLAYPAYNLHPGPPEYPGRFPSVFALYHGETEFGSTLHEMTKRVDEGQIVAVNRFPIKPEAMRLDLDIDSYMSGIVVLQYFAKAFVDPKGIPANGEKWSGKKWRKSDFDELCKLPTDIDAEEFQRRYRAIGEGPKHALEINLFGQRFVLDNERDDMVVKGGQTV